MTIYFTNAQNEKLYDKLIASLDSEGAVKFVSQAANQIAAMRGRQQVIDTWEARILFRAADVAWTTETSDCEAGLKLRDMMCLQVAKYREQQRTRTVPRPKVDDAQSCQKAFASFAKGLETGDYAAFKAAFTTAMQSQLDQYKETFDEGVDFLQGYRLSMTEIVAGSYKEGRVVTRVVCDAGDDKEHLHLELTREKNGEWAISKTLGDEGQPVIPSEE